MKEEAQRIAIAMACGWTDVKSTWQGQQCFGYEEKEHGYVTRVPDYLNDLNACAEMRDTLNDLEQARYVDELIDVLAMDGVMLWGELDAFSFADATAPQHCEAFLKAKNLWTDQ